MFGNSGNQMVHMVQRHQWEKIGKKLPGADAEAKAALATACGESSDEGAATLLVGLLQDGDEKVLLETIKALGKVGPASAKTHLQWLSNNLSGDKDKKEIRDAIGEAEAKIGTRK